MTNDSARTLAEKIMQTWTGGPTAEIWIEQLRPLDAGTAGTAIARLTRSSDRAPSVRRFLETYRGLATSFNVERRSRTDCPICDGVGWRSALPLIVGDDERIVVYTQVRPCSCPAGRAVLPVYETMIGRETAA